MNVIQSSTIEGLVVKTVGSATLVGKEGFFAKLHTDGTAILCGLGGQALYVIEEGGAVGANCTLRPLHSNRQVRAITGTDIAAADKISCDAAGKARPALAGHHVIGVAEAASDASDGAYALIRPINLGNQNVATSWPQTSAAVTGTLTGTANGGVVDIAAAAGACSGNAEPSAANVDSAIATAVAPIVSGTNEQLKELQTALNEAIADIAALKIILDANGITS